jgi:hypothetical protein
MVKLVNHVRFPCLLLALMRLLGEAQGITTVAGVNNQDYSGDGGPATSASRPTSAQTLAAGDWQLVATTQDGFSSASGVILSMI